jgi:hypothetical protein
VPIACMDLRNSCKGLPNHKHLLSFRLTSIASPLKIAWFLLLPLQ